jgi:hypothetical protein
MMEAVQSEKPGFTPEGLAEFIRSHDQTGTNRARQLMPELQLTIHDTAMELLRGLFGDDEIGWWRKGVPEKELVALTTSSSSCSTTGRLPRPIGRPSIPTSAVELMPTSA